MQKLSARARVLTRFVEVGAVLLCSNTTLPHDQRRLVGDAAAGAVLVPAYKTYIAGKGIFAANCFNSLWLRSIMPDVPAGLAAGIHNAKFGKTVRSAPFFGARRRSQDARCVAREIADGGIELRQR
jgi:hypothetical protein